ncbi:MAG: superinfection immunity protein [Acidithiobacillus ferrivorans]
MGKWLMDSVSGSMAVIVIFAVIILLVYVLPTLLGLAMGNPHPGWLALVNITLGWTVLGWLACLFWALLQGNGGTFDEDENFTGRN